MEDALLEVGRRESFSCGPAQPIACGRCSDQTAHRSSRHPILLQNPVNMEAISSRES
jgi:hypothetical protein